MIEQNAIAFESKRCIPINQRDVAASTRNPTHQSANTLSLFLTVAMAIKEEEDVM
jgi:hypothetical protein